MDKFSKQIKHSNTDEWYTPAEPVKMIVPYLRRGGFRKILCPFDTGESNFVKVLKDEFDVTYSHIEIGIDFFDIKNLHDYDAVVSNPPFSKRQKIMERLYKNDVPFALIMNFNGLFDSKSRWEMFKENGVEILIPLGRMEFLSSSPDKLTRNHPNFQSVYVCHKLLNKQIEFVEMGG